VGTGRPFEGWSTRQLAELTGTTSKAIRYYHSLGLLAEPDRGPNGYKKYAVPDLLRLMQIKRLRDLGLPLSRNPEPDAAETVTGAALESLDQDIQLTMRRLEESRRVLAAMRRSGDAGQVSAELLGVADDLAAQERALTSLLSLVLTPEQLADLAKILAGHSDEDDEFRDLPADADEATIADLAARLAPTARSLMAEHSWLAGPTGEADAVDVFSDIYNPAQLAVMKRVREATRDDVIE